MVAAKGICAQQLRSGVEAPQQSHDKLCRRSSKRGDDERSQRCCDAFHQVGVVQSHFRDAVSLEHIAERFGACVQYCCMNNTPVQPSQALLLYRKELHGSNEIPVQVRQHEARDEQRFHQKMEPILFHVAHCVEVQVLNTRSSVKCRRRGGQFSQAQQQ